jgi:predicted nucleic acid-binding protein
MLVKVVDASAIAALVFGEHEGAEAAARLRGSSLAAPALLPFEIARVGLKKLARRPGQREVLLAAFCLFRRLEISQHHVELEEAIELARLTRASTRA